MNIATYFSFLKMEREKHTYQTYLQNQLSFAIPPSFSFYSQPENIYFWLSHFFSLYDRLKSSQILVLKIKTGGIYRCYLSCVTRFYFIYSMLPVPFRLFPSYFLAPFVLFWDTYRSENLLPNAQWMPLVNKGKRLSYIWRRVTAKNPLRNGDSLFPLMNFYEDVFCLCFSPLSLFFLFTRKNIGIYISM